MVGLQVVHGRTAGVKCTRSKFSIGSAKWKSKKRSITFIEVRQAELRVKIVYMMYGM